MKRVRRHFTSPPPKATRRPASFCLFAAVQLTSKMLQGTRRLPELLPRGTVKSSGFLTTTCVLRTRSGFVHIDIACQHHRAEKRKRKLFPRENTSPFTVSLCPPFSERTKHCDHEFVRIECSTRHGAGPVRRTGFNTPSLMRPLIRRRHALTHPIRHRILFTHTQHQQQ